MEKTDGQLVPLLGDSLDPGYVEGKTDHPTSRDDWWKCAETFCYGELVTLLQK